MAIDDKTVKYVADLARIELQSNELEKLSRQLDEILDFIDQLKEADIQGVAPTSHILPLSNIFRADTAGESLSAQDVLQSAPRKQDNFYVVPKVIE